MKPWDNPTILTACEMAPSIRELGWEPDYDFAVRIEKREEVAQQLDDLVVTMKEAVAMDIRIQINPKDPYLPEKCCCSVSIYHPNNKSIRAAVHAARKERLRLSAISATSSEQWQTTTTATGDSVWLGIEPYAALYTHGDRCEFVFRVGTYRAPVSLVETFATDLGLSILRNAHSVQCLRVQVDGKVETRQFAQKFFSLDAWKEAFPSLRSVYLGREYGFDSMFDLSPHLLKHVRGLEVDAENCQCDEREPAAARQIESMIRNKECGIEEVRFEPWLLWQEELFDDTLRRVRSFRCELASEEDVDLLAGSFERTKADADHLVRLRFDDSWATRFRAKSTVERILRSRPNLHILNLGITVPMSTFVVLYPVFASSILTTLKLRVAVETAVEDKTLADGVEMLLQHPTIRDLDLTVQHDSNIRKTSQMEGDSVYHFERCVAEGLRSTSLRRFRLTVKGCGEASIAAITKMYEGARENWSLMDIRVEGALWLPWSSEWRDPFRPLSFPLSAFDFISSRNQHFSRVLMLDENTVPPGLWPLILKWCPFCEESYSQSILFSVLTLRPHIVKGKVETSIDVDNVDGPSPKRTRIN